MSMSSEALNTPEAPSAEGRSIEILHSAGEAIFGAAADGLVALGWSVFPQTKDRKPGSVRGEMIKWSEDHDLINKRPTPAALRDWKAFCAPLNVALVMGPASGHAIGIDIDVSDLETSLRIQILAFNVLGRTPFRRVGSRPKIALLYRCPEDDPVPSTSRKFADEDLHGDGLDILGAGKLLTVHGIHHRTGNWFSWIDGDCSVMTHGPEDLPVVTSAQVKQFLAEVEALRPFRQSASGAGGSLEGIEWGRADSNASVRIPRLVASRNANWVADSEGFVDDGREQYMTELVYQSVRGNQHEVQAAHSAGQEKLDGFVGALAMATHEEFCQKVRLGGRFTEQKSRRQILDKIRHLVTKFLSGGIAFPEVTEEGYEERRVIKPSEVAPARHPGVLKEKRDGLMAHLPPNREGARKPLKGWIEPSMDGDASREIQEDRNPIASLVQDGLKEAFDTFFAEVYGEVEVPRPRLHVLLAPTGAGKTSRCIRYIACDPRTYQPYEDGKDPGPIVMLLPTYANIDELRSRAKVLNLDGSLSDEDLVAAAREINILSEEQGLERAEELRRDAQNCRKISQEAGSGPEGLITMVYSGKLRAQCKRTEAVAAAMAAGVGTSVLCHTPAKKDRKTGKTIEAKECKHYHGCPAITQRQDISSAHVVFMPHSFMALQIPTELETVRAVIADERVHHLFLHTDHVSFASLRMERKPPRLRKAKEGQTVRWDDPHEVIQFRREAVEVVIEALLGGGGAGRGRCPAEALYRYSAPHFPGVKGTDLVDACLVICSGSLQRSGEIDAHSSDDEVRKFCQQPQGKEIRQEKKLWEIIRERIEQLQADEPHHSMLDGEKRRIRELNAQLGRPEADTEWQTRLLDDKYRKVFKAKGAWDHRIQLLRPIDAAGQRGPEMIRISWRDMPNWIDTPTLLLDASAQESIVRKIWNRRQEDFHLHNPVEDVGRSLNVRIVGVVSQTFSNSSIAASAGAGLEDLKRACHNLAKVRSALATVAGWAGRGRVVAGGSILARELIADGWLGPENVDWCHFGAMRGLDMFKFHTAAFSVGRMEVPVGVIDGLVAALSYDDEIPEKPYDLLGTGLNIAGEPLRMEMVPKRVRLRNGQDAILQVPGYVTEEMKDGKIEKKPSRWASILQHQYREEELLQFVGRLRPVYRTGEPPVWFALSSVLPDGLIVDDLLHIDDLTSATRASVWEAARLNSGILEPGLLHNSCPHLFPTLQDAVDDLSGAGFKVVQGVVNPQHEGSYGIARWTADGEDGIAFVPGWLGPTAASTLEDLLRSRLGLSVDEISFVSPMPPYGLARRKPDD